MSDPVSLARAARENLARGLSALQGPSVPPQVMVVAEPIANAMSALHRVEATQGGARFEAGPAPPTPPPPPPPPALPAPGGAAVPATGRPALPGRARRLSAPRAGRLSETC